MHTVVPSVYLVAVTGMSDSLWEYLDDIGAADWLQDKPADDYVASSLLSEVAGRICYRSWSPGMNENVTRIRKDQQEYLGNLLSQHHGSVFEHFSMSFIIREASRILTHELITHRVGTAKSQESLRYVRLGDIGFWEDPILSPETLAEGAELIKHFEKFYQDSVVREGLNARNADFEHKKKITSALRRFSPAGLATDILWTANLRTLRHCIEVRTGLGAEAEMRLVFDKIASIVKDVAPSVMQDFSRTWDGEWLPLNSKV